LLEKRAAAAGDDGQIIKKTPEEMQVLLSNAAKERIISAESLETSLRDLTNSYL